MTTVSFQASFKLKTPENVNLLLIPRKSLLTSKVRAHQEEFALFYLVAASFSHKTCSTITSLRMANEVFHNNLRRSFLYSYFLLL